MPDGISAFADAPVAFQPHVLETHELRVEDVLHRFVVLNRKMRRPHCFCGLDRSSQWLFISDEVPVEYRPPMLRHEVYEHHHFRGCDYPCTEALKRELSELEGLDPTVYRAWRLEVLRELSRHVHAWGQREHYAPSYQNDVSLAYVWLLTLVQHQAS